MDFLELIKKRRSIRKFKQEAVDREDLLNLIESACFAHSICNRQPLKYWIVFDSQKVDFVFENSSLGRTTEGEAGLTLKQFAPPAYIAITTTGTPTHTDFADAGSAYQNMALMAMELSLGLFWINAFAEDKLKNFLKIPENQTIMALIAIGHPAESPIAIGVEPGEAGKYFSPKDKNQKIPKLKTKYMVSWR